MSDVFYCVHLPCHTYGGGECPVTDGRRPKQQANLYWQSGWSRPSIPPPHRPSVRLRLTRRCLAAAAAQWLPTALGMEWVVYTLASPQSVLCGFTCVDLVHSTSRQLQRISSISSRVDWPTRQWLENRNRNRNLGFPPKPNRNRSKTENPKP